MAMSMQIIREDITRIKCDAIVNPTDQNLSGGGGTDAAVHAAAGRGLARACRRIGRLAAGEAVLTRGYRLPCKYVIHTVGPVWKDGQSGEVIILRSCYRNALKLASEKGCKHVAIPLIAAGTFGMPKETALDIASSEIQSFLADSDMQVDLVVYDKTSYAISKTLFDEVTAYIEENYVEEHASFQAQRPRRGHAAHVFEDADVEYNAPPVIIPPTWAPDTSASDEALPEEDGSVGTLPDYAESVGAPPDIAASYSAPKDFEASYGAPPSFAPSYGAPMESTMELSLEDQLKVLDESFSESLLRLIEAKGMTDAQCYKKANIDRRLFSKIRSDKFYQPKKTTALAFCISLELTREETEALLRKAGYTLSPSSKFDVIIRYFIEHQNYNVFEINETLFAFDQPILG